MNLKKRVLRFRQNNFVEAGSFYIHNKCYKNQSKHPNKLVTADHRHKRREVENKTEKNVKNVENVSQQEQI
jgi:hypothetical protein